MNNNQQPLVVGIHALTVVTNYITTYECSLSVAILFMMMKSLSINTEDIAYSLISLYTYDAVFTVKCQRH